MLPAELCSSEGTASKRPRVSPGESSNPRASVGRLLDQGKRVVKSLAEAHAWFHDFVFAMGAAWGPSGAQAALERIDSVLEHTSMSTAFSGVDAPGTAVEIISDSTLRLLGKPWRPPPAHVAAIEKFTYAQRKLAPACGILPRVAR